MNKLGLMTVVSIAAVAISANAETYYSTAVPGGSAILFDASGAWTNAQGSAITVTSNNRTYQNDDFVVGSGQVVAPYDNRSNSAKGFYCNTLLLEGDESAKATFVFRGSAFQYANFILGPYSEIYLDGRSTASSACGIQYSTFFIREDAVGEASARIVASEHMTNAEGARIIGPLSGSGSLIFTYHSATAVKPITLLSNTTGTGTNENFSGTMKIQGASAQYPLPLQVKTYTLDGLGGNPAAFQSKGLELEYARLVVLSNCTTTVNRGLYISEDSEVQVADGYALNVEGAFAFADSSKTLTKTGAGSLVLTGGLQSGASGGTLAVNEGTLELVAAKIENGALTAASLDALTLNGGTAAFRIAGDGSALAAGVYTVFSTTEALPAGIESCFSVDQGALPRAMATFAVDGNAVKMTVVTENTGNPCWVGAVDGTFSNRDNWLGGAMPSAGGNIVIAASREGTVTNDNGFSPASITFAPSCRAMTILGDWAGVVSVENQSAYVQTFAGRVAFSGPIAVTVASAEAYVQFDGAAVGTIPSGHTVYHGNYELTTSDYWQPEAAATLSGGSSLSVENFKGDVNTGSLVTISEGAILTVTNAFVKRESTASSGVAFLLKANYGTFRALGTVTLDSVATGNGSTKLSSSEDATGVFIMNAIENIGQGSTYFGSYKTSSGGMTRPFDNTMGYVIGAGGVSASSSRFQIGNANFISVFRPIADWTLDSLISQWNPGSKNLLQFDTTDWFDGATPRTVTVANNISGSNIECLAYGNGCLRFAFDNTFVGGFTASNSVTVALNAGCRPGNQAVTMKDASMLQVAESGTVTLGGNLTLGENTTLAFNFTRRNVAPTLAIPAASTLPATLNVKVTCDDGLSVSGLNTYTILSGCDLTGKTVNIIDPPKWVESVSVDGSGNLVLKAKSLKGFIISVH